MRKLLPWSSASGLALGLLTSFAVSADDDW